MGRRWWIASGVLLGVLALASYVLTRAADSAVSETATVFTGVDYGPDLWAPGPAVVLGGLLVVAGLLLAVAAVAYALGRRHGSTGSDVAPVVTEAEPDGEPEPFVTPDDRRQRRQGWALPAALSLSLALAAGGLVLVVTDPSSGYTLSNGTKGIAPLDNLAAVPVPGDGSYDILVAVGVVPEVAGLRYDVAVLTLEAAGFTAVDVRDRDGGPVPDGVAPDRLVDRATPEAGASPPSGTPVVLYLR